MVTTTLNHLCNASSCKGHGKTNHCLHDTDIRLLDVVLELMDALVNFFFFFFRHPHPSVSFCIVSMALTSI